MPFDANFQPLIPSLSFPPPLTKVLPAQVARSARRRSTSRLHERARHVWRRGTVHSSLGCLLEGHFRSQSCNTRIFVDATPWLGKGGARHDLYVRMRELSSKFEGVERMDCGTLSCRGCGSAEGPTRTTMPINPTFLCVFLVSLFVLISFFETR